MDTPKSLLAVDVEETLGIIQILAVVCMHISYMFACRIRRRNVWDYLFCMLADISMIFPTSLCVVDVIEILEQPFQ